MMLVLKNVVVVDEHVWCWSMLLVLKNAVGVAGCLCLWFGEVWWNLGLGFNSVWSSWVSITVYQVGVK